MPTEKRRLDVLLVERGEAASRERAQALILAGSVRVEGETVAKAGHAVSPQARIEVSHPKDEYASRGALKLLAALDRFDIPVAGRVALDVGASTGGFTDVLLRRGAPRVYAVDVGYGQLSWKLRQDPRVTVMERTNFRHLDSLPEAPDVATVDVSFISLKLILPNLLALVSPQAHAIVLVKPQFEAGRDQVGKRGVVRSASVHRDVLQVVLAAAVDMGWCVKGGMPSPVKGPAGNREFLVYLRPGDGSMDALDPIVDEALAE